MNKKIVVLTGSARKGGNSNKMAEAFIEAARAKGHNAIRHDTTAMNFTGCRGCDSCYSTGKPCTFADDFNTIAPDLLEADALVFSMPLYWYSMPSQIKGAIDKMYSFVVGGKDISGKQSALIACCEENDMSALDGIRMPYERIAALNKWTSVGEVLVTGVLNKGDIDNTDGCARAAALADKF